MGKFSKETRHSRRPKNFVLLPAFIVIILGLLFLGRNVGVIGSKLFYIIVSWQMLLIVLGLYSLIRRRFTTGGILMVGIGAFFLIPEVTNIGNGWVSTYWPLLLILAGVIMLSRFFIPSKHRNVHKFSKNEFKEQISFESEDGFVSSDNTFSSIQHVVIEPVFKGARLHNTFGGTILDLRKTSLEGPETYINVECTFGGIEIYLPSSWNVIQEVDILLGGIGDKRLNMNAEIDYEHKLIIKGDLTLSGIVLKN